MISTNRLIQNTPSCNESPSETLHLDIHNYIENAYRKCYQAHITCSYEHLLAVSDASGNLVAAVGYRPPDDDFFLEQYMNSRAEEVLSTYYGSSIKRSELVEIGNLVGDNNHAVFFLMQALWIHLTDIHYKYVMLTCTKSLQRRFRNLPLVRIKKALSLHVKNPSTWGSYYEQEPYVMAGQLCTYDQRFNHKRENTRLTLHSSFEDGTGL